MTMQHIRSHDVNTCTTCYYMYVPARSTPRFSEIHFVILSQTNYMTNQILKNTV